ncbi:unnamed protein product, partial [Mesorhabditis spiculigera]
MYVIFLLCVFMNLYVLLSREDTIFYLRIYHLLVGLLMACCSVVMIEFLWRTRGLPKLEEPHEIPTPALVGAIALTIGIAIGYLYFIVFNYSFQECDKLVDAIYNSELWIETCYDLLMSGFSVLSLIYIVQRRYYGAINTSLDKVGRLFINITFSVVWMKVVIYKGYLSHNELCQRKELEGYWCPVMKRHYECNPAYDLGGTKKIWYYLNKGLLNTAVISCASEFFPVLLVSHWLSCGGAEEKAEDIRKRAERRMGVKGLLKNFFSDISRVYGETTTDVQPLHPHYLLKWSFWVLSFVATVTAAVKWMTYFYYTIDFDALVAKHWLAADIVGLFANFVMTLLFFLLYLFARSVSDERLDAHHKAHARGDITILFGSCVVLFIKLVLQSVELEYQRVDGFIKQEEAIIQIVSLLLTHTCQWLQYFAIRRILSMSDRDFVSTKAFLPVAGVAGLVIAWVQFGYTFFDTSLIKYQLTDETFRFSSTTLICMIFTQTIFPADYLFHFTVSGCYLEMLQRYLQMGYFQLGTPRLSVSSHAHGGHGHGGHHDVHHGHDDHQQNHGNGGLKGPQAPMASIFRAAAIMERKRNEQENSDSSSESSAATRSESDSPRSRRKTYSYTLSVSTTHTDPECDGNWHFYVFALISENGVNSFRDAIETIAIPCRNYEAQNNQSEKGEITFLQPYMPDYTMKFGETVPLDVVQKFASYWPRNMSSSDFWDLGFSRVNTTEDRPVTLYFYTDLDCQTQLVPSMQELDLRWLKSNVTGNGIPIRFLWIHNEAHPEACGMELMKTATSGLFDYGTVTDPCYRQNYGMCRVEGDKPCLTATSSSPLEASTRRSSANGAWGYLGGAFGAILLMFAFCCIMREISIRCFPEWTLRHMRDDLWKMRKHLPKERRIELEEEFQAIKTGTPARNDYSTTPSAPHWRDLESADDGWEVDESDLTISNTKLGSGAYAVVYKGSLRKLPPAVTKSGAARDLPCHFEGVTLVAVKLCHSYATLEDKVDMLQEIDFMINLEAHPHILRLLGCSKNPDRPMIVTEMCPLGDLLSVLRNSKNAQIGEQDIQNEDLLTRDELLAVAWQISDALTFLSSKNIIHRDVAVRNVLMGGQKLAKLADFGLCRQTSLFYTSRGGRLPIKWMAPESLQTSEFSEKSDVWSFGVLLFELYTFGDSPFVAVDPNEMYEHLKAGNRLEIPADAPELVCQLATSCCQFDPGRRPNFEQIRRLLYAALDGQRSHYGYLDVGHAPHHHDLIEETEN